MKGCKLKNHAKIVTAATAAMLSISAQSAWAATSTGTLTVTATVTSACTVSDATLAFGDYSPTANKDATVSVSIQCTSGTAWTLYSTTTSAQRIMTKASDTLAYELYTDAGRETIFSTGGTTAGGITGTGTGIAQSNTLYGRIAASQAAPAGSYSQTANLSIEY